MKKMFLVILFFVTFFGARAMPADGIVFSSIRNSQKVHRSSLEESKKREKIFVIVSFVIVGILTSWNLALGVRFLKRGY